MSGRPDRWLLVIITVSSEPPLFIVLKQSTGGAPAPAGAYMAPNRQYVMPQQAGATPAQLGLAASMAAAPALQQWLAANSAPAAPHAPHNHDLDNVNVQINMLKEQITQSENNLNAQHTVSIFIFSFSYTSHWSSYTIRANLLLLGSHNSLTHGDLYQCRLKA